jgi:hypothetical protein
MSATASRERQRKEGVKLMSTTQGKFVWYDLMTGDSKAAEHVFQVHAIDAFGRVIVAKGASAQGR